MSKERPDIPDLPPQCDDCKVSYPREHMWYCRNLVVAVPESPVEPLEDDEAHIVRGYN